MGKFACGHPHGTDAALGTSRGFPASRALPAEQFPPKQREATRVGTTRRRHRDDSRFPSARWLGPASTWGQTAIECCRPSRGERFRCSAGALEGGPCDGARSHAAGRAPCAPSTRPGARRRALLAARLPPLVCRRPPRRRCRYRHCAVSRRPLEPCDHERRRPPTRGREAPRRRAPSRSVRGKSRSRRALDRSSAALGEPTTPGHPPGARGDPLLGAGAPLPLRPTASGTARRWVLERELACLQARV